VLVGDPAPRTAAACRVGAAPVGEEEKHVTREMRLTCGPHMSVTSTHISFFSNQTKNEG
jgi:hypothetical protein